MRMIQIQQWQLAIQHDETKMVYEMNGYRCDTEECHNFVKASANLNDEVVAFAEQLAIDLIKPSQLTGHRVEGKSVMYTGQYHIVGEIIEGDMGGWDMIVGEHCFSLTDEFSHIPLMMPESVIEVSFEVVLPWVL